LHDALPIYGDAQLGFGAFDFSGTRAACNVARRFARCGGACFGLRFSGGERGLREDDKCIANIHRVAFVHEHLHRTRGLHRAHVYLDNFEGADGDVVVVAVAGGEEEGEQGEEERAGSSNLASRLLEEHGRSRGIYYDGCLLGHSEVSSTYCLTFALFVHSFRAMRTMLSVWAWTAAVLCVVLGFPIVAL